jgi:mannosyltransferase OCH1-like enzyme
MIPKIIHYVWIGGKPLPDIAKKCIASWKRYCPDWQIIQWDETNLDLQSCDYVKEAVAAKKWAFASDVLRLEKLYEYGGVYLDVDVELLRPLDEFLKEHCFGGFESGNVINPGVIFGTEKDNLDIKNILDDYYSSNFVKNGKMDLTTICERVTKYYEKSGLKRIDEFQKLQNITVYPSEYFSPINTITNKKHVTKNTHSIHWYNASWYPTNKKFARMVKKVLNFFTFGLFGKILYRSKNK